MHRTFYCLEKTMKTSILFFILALANIAAAQQIETINPEGMTQPKSYSHLVKYGDLMFIAGQVALDGDGNVIGEGDMAAQFRQVLENLKSILQSEGADFSDIVKITIFTTDIEKYIEAAPLRSEYFGEHAPAGTLVQIERLARPVFLVEVEAIAIKP